MSEITKDYDFRANTRQGYQEQIERFVRERNGGVDFSSKANRAFIERIVTLVQERHGHLVADDYNFNVRALNEAAGTSKKKP